MEAFQQSLNNTCTVPHVQFYCLVSSSAWNADSLNMRPKGTSRYSKPSLEGTQRQPVGMDVGPLGTWEDY
ncbi:hypothetical protein J6590_015892 [Homalodisca vitripennis]|nr:hypothetical protein J6590_015892 [Homalodisca vitripennis]